LHLLQQTEASLRRSIHEKNSKILKLQSSKDKIGEHLKQAKADIAHLEVDAKTNKQLVAQLLSQKESLESSIASLQDEANALKDVVDHSEHKLAATERQLKHIADQNNNTTTQLIAAENMLKELEAAKVKVENEAELLREQHNESEQLNRTHTCRITELENEIGEIQAQVSELRERKHEHEQIEASLRGELTELEGRFTRHEQDHSEINARLIETTESLEEARTALNAERKKSQELLALRDELKKTIATQEKRAAISDNVIKALREQLATAQSNIASLERGKGQLNEELNQSNMRLEEARAIERQLRDQVQDLEKSIAERQASAASLRSMLESALNAEAGSSQRISDLGSELDDVNGKLLQTEAKLTECSIKLTESERLRKEADSQLTHVKASHSEALDALDSERQRSEQLDTHLVNEKRSVDSVKQLLLEVQSNLDASKGAHANLQAAKSSLEDELKQTRVEKVSLKEQLSRQMACSHALNEQIRAMTMTQVYLTQELEKQRDQSQTTDHEIARLRVSLAEALDSSNTHQLSSEAAQEQVTNLKAQLRSLEAKFV
jgi:chromosome segregation ATPase